GTANMAKATRGRRGSPGGPRVPGASGGERSHCFEIFAECVKAMAAGRLIRKVSAKDKEYHFQDWFRERLETAKVQCDDPGRNSYPDFKLVHAPEGFELKALAYPGRLADFDANSQVPTGHHNGRAIFYVFG